MTCRDVDLRLTGYVLGELDLATHRLIEQHLDECGDCRAEELQTRQDLARINDALKTELTAPSGLLENFSKRLNPKRTNFLNRTFPKIALAGLSLAFGIGVWLRPIHASETVMQEASIVPETFLSSKLDRHPNLQTTLVASEAFNRDKDIGFVVDAPTSRNIQFKYGGCIMCGKDRVPAFVFDDRGRELVLFESSKIKTDRTGLKKISMNGKEFYCGSCEGKALVMWETGGHMNILMGATGESSLAETAISHFL